MPAVVYRIYDLLDQVLTDVPVGTNLGLLHLLWTLLSGRFLNARGAVFAALDALGLPPAAVRRANNALAYGRWNLADLLARWQQAIVAERRWVANTYEGICPVAADLTGFFRPQLRGCASKHYVAQAGKALPATLIGLVAAVGHLGSQRLAVPRLMRVGSARETTDAALESRLIQEASTTLADNEALIVDAGFDLADLLAAGGRFVMRLPKNFTARRNALPAYRGRGRRPEYGQVVRPLARQRAGKTTPATAPEATARWKEGRWTLRAYLWSNLVLRSKRPGAAAFRVVVIFDPRYKEPLVLATNLLVSAYALWHLYKDRWPIEQLPLVAKTILGAERAFVFGPDSRVRLPQLALLAGNLLAYVAATSVPVASGFWDRCARPTCGRLRRVLNRLDFSQLPVPEGQLRKKKSVTAHLPKGVQGHRRIKAISEPMSGTKAA
jgi:DDE family transposase